MKNIHCINTTATNNSSSVYPTDTEQLPDTKMAFTFDVSKRAKGIDLEVIYRDQKTTKITLDTPQVAALLAIADKLETTVKEAALITTPTCDGAVFTKTWLGASIFATVSYW